LAESKQIRKAVEVEVARKLEQRAKTWLKAAKEQGGASSTTRVVVNELLAVADRLAGKRARKINTRIEEPAPEPVVIEGATLFNADNIHVLRSLPSCSVDALVIDPPSGIAFMSKQWDRDKGGRDGWVGWFAEVMTECHRVMKPGAHALVWALPRTSHWTSLAIEQAEFEIRDILMHIFGTGFPKSTDVSKQVDRALGAEREKVKTPMTSKSTAGKGSSVEIDPRPWMLEAREKGYHEHDGPTPATDEAKQWAGWGTALKPSHEAWILARKPLSGTVAANVLEHGTGALNIDATRIGTSKRVPGGLSRTKGNSLSGSADGSLRRETGEEGGHNPNIGRWPPHLLLTHAADCGETCADGCPVAEMDAQSGVSASGVAVRRNVGHSTQGLIGYAQGSNDENMRDDVGYGDTGGASRFFPVFRYSAKPSTRERNAGCDAIEPRQMDTERDADADGANNPRNRGGKVSSNHHPTLKSIDLMRWLVRLITPPNGVVLDCFMGSGTTGIAATLEGARFIGIEREPDYFEIACARIEHHTKENT
jgi:site-specific DNA-methyltransferase (adenine-specific)